MKRGTKLGGGGHGDVFHTHDHSGNNFAVKVIKTDLVSGTIALMEVLIMSSFHSPYLAHATFITQQDDRTLITSEMASMDLETLLSQYVEPEPEKEKKSKLANLKMVKSVLFAESKSIISYKGSKSNIEGKREQHEKGDASPLLLSKSDGAIQYGLSGKLPISDPNLLQTKNILHWGKSLLIAIAQLHSANVIHNDIKASNILLYHDNSIKLTDFTLSCWAWIPQLQPETASCTETHRPLEVWLNKAWSTEVDIWALGCTLYHLYTKKLLFPARKSAEKYIKQLNEFAHMRKHCSHEELRAKLFAEQALTDTAEDCTLQKLILDCLVSDRTVRASAQTLLATYYDQKEMPSLLINQLSPVTAIDTSKQYEKWQAFLANKIEALKKSNALTPRKMELWKKLADAIAKLLLSVGADLFPLEYIYTFALKLTGYTITSLPHGYAEVEQKFMQMVNYCYFIGNVA